MPNFFLTFRAHPSEPQVFEDFILIFLKTIQKKSRYAWSIEWDGTPQRHIHCVLCDVPDISKVNQLLNTKHYKLFKQSLDDKYTTWNSDDDNKGFQNIIRIDDSDPEKSTIYYLGYTNKHNNSRRDQKDFTQQEITDAVKEYHSIKRISHRPEKNNNIKLITNKNIYQNIISFVENPENDTSYDDRYLKYKTIKSGFGYSQVSDKTEEKVFQELRIMNNQEWKNDKEISNLKSIPQQETVDIYKYEELKNRTQNDIEFLMLILQNQNLSLPPQDIARIKNISYLYKIHEKC